MTLCNPAVKLRGSKKFSVSFRGPYEIVSKQGETNCTIKPLRPGLREETVHQNKLKNHICNQRKL